MRHVSPSRKHHPDLLSANPPGPAGTGAVLPRPRPLSGPRRTPRAWRGAACALAAAFALLLGAGAAEAQETGTRELNVATVNGGTLTVYFSFPLRGTSTPGSAFTVRATPSGGTARTIAGTGTVAVSGLNATVTLQSAVSDGETVTVSYTVPATNPLLWTDGAGVGAFGRRTAINKTDATPPNVAFAQVDGTTLTLYYDDRLKHSAVPSRFDFWVQKGEGSPAARPFGNPSVFSNTVTIQLFNSLAPAKHGQTVRFAYDLPSNKANRIQDRSGNQAPAIAQWADIDNVTPPALVSAVVRGAALILTFDGDLEEDGELVPPASAFTVLRVRSGATTTVDLVATNPVAVSGRTVTLSLAEAVLSTDTVHVRYAAPTTGARLRDDDNYERPVSSFPNRQASNLTPGASIGSPPQFSSAAVNGTMLTVTFNEPLQTGSSHRPRNSAFAVIAKPLYGTARTIASAAGNVSISGSTVTVTLADEVERGESVAVGYTEPSTNFLRGTNGFHANSFSGQPAANNTPGSPAPTFESASYSYPRGGIVVNFTGPFLGCADRNAWIIKVDGAERYPQVARCEDRAVLLVLAALTDRPAVEAASSVTVSYHRGVAEAMERSTPLFHPPRGSRGPSARLRGTDGSVVESFDDQPVSGLKPRLVPPPTVDGSTLTLTFNEEMDPGATPGNWLFHVAVNGERRHLARSGGVAIDGKTVRLTLRSAVTSGGDTVTVRYTRPERCWGHCSWGLRGASHIVVDTFPDQAVTNNSGGPVVSSAAVVWETLTLTFNRNLDTGSKPAPGAFHVTVNNARRSVASGGVAIAGKTVTLTLASEVAEGDTVKVRYTKPSSNPLRSTDGFAVDTFADQAVTNNILTIWSATLAVKTVTSDTIGCDDTTGAKCSTGSTLLPTTFSYASETYQVKAITVQELSLVNVHYTVVTITLDKVWPQALRNSATLQFDTNRYDLADLDVGSGGKSLAILFAGLSGISLNQQVSLRLTTGTSGGTSGTSALIAGEAPWVTEVSVASDAGADRTYGLGDTVRVRVDFVEPVEVTGTPRLKIDMDPAAWGEKWAAYESGSGTGTLTFAHTVVEPNFSSQGIAVLANSLETGGGTIRAGGADATLAHDGLDHDANHKVNWQTQPESAGPSGTSGTGTDSGPPTVTGVSVVSDPGDDDTYLLGDTIRIRATFDQAVNVTGSPRLSIDMDPAAWGTKQAAYASGGGTSSLTFAWTVVEPNFSPQGIAVLANSLALNGGTIRSAAANENAALAHTGLGHDSGHKVDWRPEISVADARANEAAGATVAFQVSLSRAFTNAEHRVTVDYATADGTAVAGADYTATSGTLTFAAGETSKTVNVPILDDSHDEGEETFTLRLSNAAGARIGDGEATGTIVNTDAMPRAWLARFGRTVAGQVLDAVGARMDGPSSAPTRVTLGGQEMLLGDAAADALGGGLAPGGGPSLAGRRGDLRQRGEDSPARETSMSELLLASSFYMASAERADSGPRWSLWGRGARSGFDGAEGALTLTGDVTTGLVGADYESGRVLVGVALALSSGDGAYEESGMRGEVESSLAGVYPYLRYAVSERLSVWGLAGLGEGDLTLKPAGAAQVETDLSMSMAAAGARGALVTSGGFELALRSDLAFVRTESDAAAGLAAAEADTSRLRLALEGSAGEMRFAAGVLTPTVELGLRFDGGDAETGAGLELGGGLRYASGRLAVEFNARGLLAHEEREYEEWGVSASVRFSPDEGGRGLSLRAASTWGAAAGGVDRLWSQRAAADLARGAFEPGGAGVDAEVGYGFDLPRGLLTPYTGVALSQNAETWRAGARWKLGPAFDVALEASLREPANGEDTESGLLLKGSRRW